MYKKDLIANKTKKSLKIIEPRINKINKYFDSLEKEKYITPKFRKYIKKKYTKTKNAYSSFIIINDDYMPAILTLGYTLRKYTKKYNLVCMVQDKPVTFTIDGKKVYYPGISKDKINDILDIYDIVYGIDLLKTECLISDNHFTSTPGFYKDIKTYVTKAQVFGLTDYDRIFYLDAATIVTKNIDNLFDMYKDNHFLNDRDFKKHNMGVNGAVFIIKTNNFLYTKAMYYIYFYNKIFGNLFFGRGVDEIIIYFTVYPNWSKTPIKKFTKCYDIFADSNCPIYHYQRLKPFKQIHNKRRKNKYTFNVWDKYASEFIKHYPQYYKYFSHIKNIREVSY